MSTTITLTWREDRNIQNNRIKAISDATAEGVAEASEMIVGYIRSHWSPDSPSAPGATPAIANQAGSSGLDSTMEIQDTSSGVISSNVIVFPATNSQGNEYAGLLEKGTKNMDARPYLEPARAVFRDILISRIRLNISRTNNNDY